MSDYQIINQWSLYSKNHLPAVSRSAVRGVEAWPLQKKSGYVYCALETCF